MQIVFAPVPTGTCDGDDKDKDLTICSHNTRISCTNNADCGDGNTCGAGTANSCTVISGKNPEVNNVVKNKPLEDYSYPIAVQLCNRDSMECVDYKYTEDDNDIKIFELQHASSTFWGPTENTQRPYDTNNFDTGNTVTNGRGITRGDPDKDFVTCCSSTLISGTGNLDCRYASSTKARRAASTKETCEAAGVGGTWVGKGIYLKISMINNGKADAKTINDQRVEFNTVTNSPNMVKSIFRAFSCTGGTCDGSEATKSACDACSGAFTANPLVTAGGSTRGLGCTGTSHLECDTAGQAGTSSDSTDCTSGATCYDYRGTCGGSGTTCTIDSDCTSSGTCVKSVDYCDSTTNNRQWYHFVMEYPPVNVSQSTFTHRLGLSMGTNLYKPLA